MSEIFAIGSALCIALGAILSGELAGRVDVLRLARWQTLTATMLTGTVSLAVAGWQTLELWHTGLLMASGLFGITFASLAYLAAIFKLGPRLLALVFSLTSPFALLFGYIFLGETVTAQQGAGIVLVLCGILLAILFGNRRDSENGLLAGLLGQASAAGLAFGVAAAMGQALGTLLARPAMAAGVEPFTAMMVRAAVGTVSFYVALLWPWRRPSGSFTRRDLLLGVASAVAGTGFGMAMLMAALKDGNVGLVSTLSSLVPVVILPMLWLRTGVMPGWAAWLGALVAVAGTGLIALT